MLFCGVLLGGSIQHLTGHQQFIPYVNNVKLIGILFTVPVIACSVIIGVYSVTEMEKKR